MKLLVIAALFASTCTHGDPTSPGPSAPDPSDTVDVPIFDASAPTNCASAIENSKRLGCTFEAADASGWCATRTSTEISCMAKAQSCLALRTCTEPKK